VEAVVDGNAALKSRPIWANTEVDRPSKPIVSNVSCVDTGKIYVEWFRYSELIQRPVLKNTLLRNLQNPTYIGPA
jgi:hypothetical protein